MLVRVRVCMLFVLDEEENMVNKSIFFIIVPSLSAKRARSQAALAELFDMKEDSVPSTTPLPPIITSRYYSKYLLPETE